MGPLSEYTPTTVEVRNEWAGSRADSYALAVEHADAIAEAEFDRWLAEVERTAAAQALEEAADEINLSALLDRWVIHNAEASAEVWLRARAAEIRKGKSDE